MPPHKKKRTELTRPPAIMQSAKYAQQPSTSAAHQNAVAVARGQLAAAVAVLARFVNSARAADAPIVDFLTRGEGLERR